MVRLVINCRDLDSLHASNIFFLGQTRHSPASIRVHPSSVIPEFAKQISGILETTVPSNVLTKVLDIYFVNSRMTTSSL